MAEDESKEGTSKMGTFGAIGLVAGLIIGYLIGSSGTGKVGITDTTKTADGAKTTEIQLVNHIQAELPEQDVYVERTTGSSQVMRIDVAEAEDQINLDKTVYSTATPTAHDPFKLGENPLGPFVKGKSLGFTLADWLAGTGTGTYEVEGSTASLELSMQNLVPDGVYTVWCSRLKFPPGPVVLDMPCGAMDGSENAFTADASGDGEFSITMSPLESSTETTANVIALAYHSDGETYGLEPGQFGSVSHIQLLFLMPAEE